MAGILPSRYAPYEELLNRRLHEAASLAGRAPEPRRRFPRSLLLAGATLALVAPLLCGRRADDSRLPAGRKTLFSADLLGGGTAAADYVTPPPRSPSPSAPSPSPSPHAPPRPRPSPTPCVQCDAPAPVTEVLYESPPASPSPPPILPAGTRLAARLSQPLVVGPGGAPVVVDLADDVPIDARTAVPRGTRLVGEARVGPEGERAQLSFTSLVLRGRSLGLSGIAMGPDNQVGLTGKVVKRLTATRRGLGKALHAVGTALSFGLIGTTSPAGEAATQAVAGEVSGLSRSDEAPVVLEVAAGPLVVFVRADVSLP